jgi:hypothetical protein
VLASVLYCTDENISPDNNAGSGEWHENRISFVAIPACGKAGALSHGVWTWIPPVPFWFGIITLVSK